MKISADELTPEQTQSILAKLRTHVELSLVIEHCTAYGKGKLKTNKPTDGIYAYVWRMARFHSGADMTMPVTCFWDLEEGIQQLTGLRVSTCFVRGGVKAIIDELNQKADELVEATGGDRLAAAMRYGQAMGYVR